MTFKVLLVVPLAVLGLACGSTAGPPPDGSPGSDGGGFPDGGAVDGGAVDGGQAADGGSGTWRIIPGEGLDVTPSPGTVASLRVGQTAAQVRSLIGSGTDSSLFAGPHDRSYDGDRYLLFYSNTDQSESGGSSTFTDPDILRILTAGPSFGGTTADGIGPGSARTAWLGRYGGPDLTLVSAANPGDTSDHYFGRGLVVTYGSGTGVASSLNVFRPSRKPDETLEVRALRVGQIVIKSDGSGSTPSTIQNVWGAPDQIEDFSVSIVDGRNFLYASLGIIFATQRTFGLGEFTVHGVIVFDPYYGRTDIGNLGVRSPKASFDSEFSSGSCPPLSASLVDLQWTVYRLAQGSCNIRLGVSWDNQGRAALIYLNFPNI